MPNYGTPQAGSNWANPGLNVTSVVPGDVTVFLFNNETPAAPQASVPMAYASVPPSANLSGYSVTSPSVYSILPVAFNLSWATPPSAFSVTIQAVVAGNADLDANYANVTTITSTPYTYNPSVAYLNRAYWRARLVTNTGGVGLTVTMQP